MPMNDRPIALVTGGGRGIGRAAAESLAASGWHVVPAARTPQECAETAELVRRAGGTATPRTLDLGDLPGFAPFVAEVERTIGPVEALVSDEDSAVAIFGPGEAVELAFTVPQATLPAGWTRTFVLEFRGWCKDMDLYTRDGETIEPLPGKDTAARRTLHPRFNTRYAGGS